MCMSYEKCLIIGFETMEHYANDGVYIKLKQKHFNIYNVTIFYHKTKGKVDI